MRIDLHCHTNLSDGATAPEELLELARLRGVDVLAVTDHDTLLGGQRASALGERAGIRVIPGVEISAWDGTRGRRVHILCYQPRKPACLEGILEEVSQRRRAAMEASVEKVCRLYPISPEMIAARSQCSTNIYKQHVMRALVDTGYADRMFGEVFRQLFHPKTGVAYTPIKYADVLEVIACIREAEGLAVMAHPSEFDSMDLLRELCEKGLLDGAELNHPRNTPEDREAIRELCDRYGLAATGGTDFHGCNTRRPLPLGSFLTDEREFDTLMAKQL